ncbi:hypothetical protein AWC38_SpisGene3964 [Stylophora pistillata]|uniref:Uncharacterized protein n=2 Tax=Stylophora pistillata TaxID=50429 RepID=A0A2B4SKL4_STYPI|nr:hypothetical protein AWC38_SpisGene3964 [Stylophora pistillata]
MENSSSRFFQGFSLEDYRLQALFKTLEKEKKQCLNQLKEQTHLFKMSLRPPVKSGEEYWSQYGENYHANGDKRERDSVTHLSAELKEDLNKNNTMPVSPKINSPAEDEHCGLNPSGKRPRYFQRNKSKQNADRNAQRKKKPESISLTLLEILCSDVENGVLLTKTGNHSYSGCEASEKCFKDGVSRIRSQSNQEERLNVVGQPEVRNRSTSTSSAAVHNFENSLKSPSSTDLSCQVTNTSELERSVQNLSLSSVHSKIDFWPGETPKSSQSTKINIRKDVARNLESSRNSSTTKNERSMDSDGSGSCRFVHFSDGRKLKKKKGKKKDPGTKQANDKLNRTESSDVKFFQIDVPPGSNRGKSQEEMAKETREKMDQFFAKVDRTKSFQTKRLRWRCVSGNSGRSAWKRENKACLDQEKLLPQEIKNVKGYRRAHPWPTQVWS